MEILGVIGKFKLQQFTFVNCLALENPTAFPKLEIGKCKSYGMSINGIYQNLEYANINQVSAQ
jgi:hypothetical protein